ncbi:MAG: SMP-30/gluconolactonase/LRE family protein [Bacteroidales bacterium]|nr:SMP-30/gluconolactonase/LRE family protein [Bacteroidales bacterium]
MITSCNSNKNKKSLKPVEQKIAELEFKTNSLLGEGAFWDFKNQKLYWVDIEGKKLHIYNPDSKMNQILSTPTRIGTVVPIDNKEAIIALEDGVYKIDTYTGNIELLSDVESKQVENRFNDGKCDINGNLWVGSMHLDQSKPVAALYKINKSGKAEKMLDSITISNGIVWTSDNKTMYYIDTPRGNIRAFDFDASNSTISNERIAVYVPESLGYPDGMTIDEENMLWVGLWNGNAVARFNPQNGKLISKIDVPAHNVTSCAFGGTNLDKLYITTASVDMTEDEKKKYPNAGSIFVVTPGVKGVKGNYFGGN